MKITDYSSMGLIILLSIIFSNICIGQKRKIQIESVKEFHYYNIENGIALDSGVLISNSIYSIDGNETLKILYQNNGDVDKIIVYQYNDNHKIIGTNEYNNYGILQSETKYNDGLNSIPLCSYPYVKCIFDKNNNPVEVNVYSEEKVLSDGYKEKAITAIYKFIYSYY